MVRRAVRRKAMHPQVEQELAYVLLTELLAYQLASPVKWIETQEVLLVKQKLEQLVEIGPSETLISMAKKTLASQHQKHDPLLASRRKLLSCKKDAREIRYEADPLEAPLHGPPVVGGSTITEPVKLLAIERSTIPLTMSAGQEFQATPAPVTSIADVPVTAREIVVTIIAQKLHKALGGVPTEKTIKQLVGGRSTLENEIVGDIGAEFGTLPERAEEMELESLCKELQSSPSFTGQLRKTSIALTTRLFSLKMPVGFNSTRAREYLARRWGLGQGRQDSVFFHASTVQPAARLPTEAEAQAFFDNTVRQYASENSLTLAASSSSSATAPSTTGPVVVDSKALAVITRDQESRRRAEIELYSKLYDVDLHAGERAALKTRSIVDGLQGQLDLLNAELGDAFTAGISPSWAAAKVRHFDSSWNWVLQDALEIFYDILQGRSKMTDRRVLERSILIANRSSPRLLRVMGHLMEVSWPGSGDRAEMAKDFLRYVTGLCESTSPRPFVGLKGTSGMAPSTKVGLRGKVEYLEVPRSAAETVPAVHLRTKEGSRWARNEKSTAKYLELIDQARRAGLSFKDKNVLVTGASPNSIGAEVVRGLLAAGARVIVTTSSYTSAVVRFYQETYTYYGAKGSRLTVVPFNQGSQQDLEALVLHIYDPVTGLGLDLHHVVPFAAIPEKGREVDGIDSRSELAHRIMLTNIVRLLGAIKRQKELRGYDTRPTQVVLPLSPNHGCFGGDGLYAESKIALESLFDKWHSENWAAFLSICGAVIGWTRGTGLMADNDIVAAGIEKEGVRTFSQSEMALYTLVLMSRPIARQNELEPIYADLTGGMSNVSDFKGLISDVQHQITEASGILKAIAEEEALELALITGRKAPDASTEEVRERANIQFSFPTLPDWDSEIAPLAGDLHGMVDLDRVVVITGFSEVGPYGNARTRWEMEAHGKFSLEGCVEMAWIMGLIKHHNGVLEGQHYNGWVDAKTLKAVPDHEIKARYETHILEHTGIRLIEPELDEGYDPQRKQILQEIVLEADLAPFVVPRETAAQFEREHKDLVDVFEDPGSSEFSVRLKKGATLLVPKAISFDRTVAGQIPTGWDARTYGISSDIIAQVDRVTLFALVSTVEALLSSGITDPYELYKHLHVSEIGNCVGSGVGGMMSLKNMFKTRYMDRPVQNDVLQETFINTTAAWVNMLLLSSSGPIRTPVGACATAIESLETGYETIVGGRAKMCLVGGFDDMTEAISYEFANMKATSNAEDEFAKGREPKDMSRPTASTRSGFMESQGGGVQVITSARLALDMGLPIHAVVAWVGTSSDKIGRSVPAPGKGILANAREAPSRFRSPLLDVKYRWRRLEMRKTQIRQCLDMELDLLREEQLDPARCDTSSDCTERIAHRTVQLQREAGRQVKEALNSLGNAFFASEPTISPLRGALAVWNLSPDDLTFASFHGTSTVKNDVNETAVLNAQLAHLGRRPGNPLPGVFQKYLTGHAKGGAGAWMLNGACQALDAAVVPGNRNADNVDEALAGSEFVHYPNRALHLPRGAAKAFSVTSFGFGQKGAQMLGVHPRHLFATLDRARFDGYADAVRRRHRGASRAFHRGMATHTVFVAKEAAPYRDGQEAGVLLDPEARVREAGEGGGYRF